MPNLIEFLQARLAEDEATAKATMGTLDETWCINTGPYAIQRPTIETGGMGWKTASGEGIWACDDPEDNCEQHRTQDQAEAAHIIRHDPTRVLAEVAAKRTIIESYNNEQKLLAKGHNTSHALGAQMVRHQVLEALAYAYSDHLDHPIEWEINEEDDYAGVRKE